MAKYAELTSAQQQDILTNRPDVAANKYYSKNVSEWYGKYGQNENYKFGNTATTAETSPTSPTYTGTGYPTLSSFTAPAAITTPTYTFDANAVLPQIQQQASAIYDPQQKQLQALQEMTKTQAAQQKIQTEADFQKTLKSEIESINNRGAYFSGGAIANEQQLTQQNQYAQNMQDLQTQATLLDYQTKQGQLSAEQSKYVQDELVNNEASAYNRFKDNRDFIYQMNRDQMGDYWKNVEFNYNQQQDAQDYALRKDMFNWQVLTDQRNYNFDVEKFKKEYSLSTKQFELEKAKFTEDSAQFGISTALQKAELSLSASKTDDTTQKSYNNDVDKYVTAVLNGTKTREQARDLLNSAYGNGSGQIIYDMVSDGQYASVSSKGV